MAWLNNDMRSCCVCCMQPDPVAGASLEAWYMDDSAEDQRAPHKYVILSGPWQLSNHHTALSFTGMCLLLQADTQQAVPT